MIKVAVCFAGDPRQYKRCYITFRDNVLNAVDYEFDIFISSWDSKIRHFKKFIPDDDSFDKVLYLYKPVKYSYIKYDQQKRRELYEKTRMNQFQNFVKKYRKCDSSHKKDKCRICGNLNIHNQIGQLFNVWNANQLKCKYEKENNFIYDYVIRNRFDNYFFTPLTEQDYKQVKQNNLLIPHGFDDFPEYGNGVNDQFAIGTSQIMNIYSELYNNMYDIAMDNALKKHGYGIPHLAITQYMNKNNINIQRMPLEYVIYKKINLYKQRIKTINLQDIRV